VFSWISSIDVKIIEGQRDKHGNMECFLTGCGLGTHTLLMEMLMYLPSAKHVMIATAMKNNGILCIYLPWAI
jgi:hypothetical protein